MSRGKYVVTALAGLVLGGAAMALATGQAPAADPERARIEQIVRDYILENPEIIPEAIQRLQQREVGKAIDQNRAALETPFAGAWAGAADGDVVLVEFYDYACGYCRRSIADVDRLLAEDKKLKVVYRELPVLGDDSMTAALSSLAAAQAGQASFRTFYHELFKAGSPDAAAVAAARAAASSPAPPAQMPDLQAEIDKNFELARTLGANGTPLFVVGDQVFQGAVGYDALKQAIAEVRARK